MSFFKYIVVHWNDSSRGNWDGDVQIKTTKTKSSRFHDARIIGYQNYEAKIYLAH